MSNPVSNSPRQTKPVKNLDQEKLSSADKVPDHIKTQPGKSDRSQVGEEIIRKTKKQRSLKSPRSPVEGQISPGPKSRASNSSKLAYDKESESSESERSHEDQKSKGNSSSEKPKSRPSPQRRADWKRRSEKKEGRSANLSGNFSSAVNSKSEESGKAQPSTQNSGNSSATSGSDPGKWPLDGDEALQAVREKIKAEVKELAANAEAVRKSRPGEVHEAKVADQLNQASTASKKKQVFSEIAKPGTVIVFGRIACKGDTTTEWNPSFRYIPRKSQHYPRNS